MTTILLPCQLVILVIVPVNVVANGFVSSASTSYFTLLLLKKPNVCGFTASSENYETLVVFELSFRFIHVDSVRLSLFC